MIRRGPILGRERAFGTMPFLLSWTSQDLKIHKICCYDKICKPCYNNPSLNSKVCQVVLAKSWEETCDPV